MKYKVGDKVKVIELDRICTYYDDSRRNPLGVTSNMCAKNGQIVTIREVVEYKQAYRIIEDGGYYLWNDAMLLPVRFNKYKVKGGIHYDN